MSDRIRANADDATAPAHILRYRELFDWLTDMEWEIETYRDVVDAEDPNVQELLDLGRSARDDGQELLEEGRLLRLGVIGQMKAGKSSLINSLLFEGREVLPKAATPMTASLTHIVKSDRDEVEIEYYSRSDWDEIRKHANQYRQAYLDPRREGDGGEITAFGRNSKSPPPPRKPLPFLQASHELVEMAEARAIDVDRYAGKTCRQPASVVTLNRTLRQQVGADGSLTPLVKSVRIGCSQGIPDIDIVDTPGINDPIVSRSRETRKLLDRCDAVLLLSYAGQFMDSEDAMFFQERAPAAGIARRLLLASKFDSALFDEAEKYSGDLESAMDDCQRRLAKHAVDALQRTAAEGKDIRVTEGEVLFVSSMCTNLARKPGGDWSEDECQAFENLRRAYPDWLDPVEDAATEATVENLTRIGGQIGVCEQLDAIRHDKGAIIEKKMADFIKEKRCRMTSELEEIVHDLRGSRDELCNGDLEKNKEKLAKLRETIEDIKDEVEQIWEEVVDGQRSRFLKLFEEVHEEVKEAKEKVRGSGKTEQTEDKDNKKKGLLPWFSRLLGVKGGYESYENWVVDKASLRRVIEDYAAEVKKRLDDTIRDSFPRSIRKDVVDDLSATIADRVPDEVASDINFNLHRTLRRSIGGICRSARESIKNSLSGDIFEIEELGPEDQKDARNTINRIEKEVKAWLETVECRIEGLMKQAKNILDPISKEFESRTKRLEDEHANGEFQLQRYALALDAIERCIETAPK